jgi:hypothetical protein
MNASSAKTHQDSRSGAWSEAAAGYRFAADDDPDDGTPERAGRRPQPKEREDLPYRVELWDASKTSVEQVLAVTASAGIGYAAYYGATREFPHRYVTLRHKNSIISRWNGPTH